jgi:hypothetical protein
MGVCLLVSRHSPTTKLQVPTRASLTTKRAGFLDQYFYFSMSLLIAAITVYGFSRTIDHNLIHAAPVRPWILYLHATIFSGWVVFFIVQSSLVRTRNVKVHRRLGWFGVGLGVVIPFLAVSTAISMARFSIHNFHSHFVAPFLIVQFCDVTSFTVPFALAIYWRRKPEFHRRLILIAACALTGAAFGRFPASVLPFAWFYIGVDLLVFLGLLRDLIVTRRVHPVYLYALPLLIVGQTFAMRTFLTGASWWLRIADVILR